MVQPPKPLHDHEPLKFPDGFLWGAATSAHQVEGNNTLNDWWQFEQGLPEDMRSGNAANQYQLFEQDFDLAKKLGHNTHRLSLEWSRIEPQKGHFDEAEIAHYKKVLQALKDRGFVVMLTLHHFTNPLWLINEGGFENSSAVSHFQAYVARVTQEYQGLVDFWITINEPGVYTGQAYINGVFPPNKKSWIAAIKVTYNLAQAHKRAYSVIHQLIPQAKVGMSQNAFSFRGMQAHSIIQHILVWFYDLSINHLFYILTGINTHDFLGLNYYLHERISTSSGGKLPQLLSAKSSKKDVSDLGWEVYPEGIFDILEDFSDYHKPIYITENGLASTNDDRRCRFLIGYLKEIYHAIATGVEVKGYFHWSLLDNFEWEHGFNPRFGLVEVDYSTQKRTPRLSASVYSEIIKHNAITHRLLRFLGHTVDAKEVLQLVKLKG